jgi:hypothetical protein
MKIKLRCEYVSDDSLFEDTDTTTIALNDRTTEKIFNVVDLSRNIKSNVTMSIFVSCSDTLNRYKFEICDGDIANISFIEEHDETADYIRWGIVDVEYFEEMFYERMHL